MSARSTRSISSGGQFASGAPQAMTNTDGLFLSSTDAVSIADIKPSNVIG
jgi:hypothetical protein